MSEISALREFGLKLESAIARDSSSRPGPRWRLAVVAVAGVFVFAGGVAVASRLLPFGAAVEGPGRGEVPAAMRPLPGTVALAPVRLASAFGGLPWGLRVASTSSGRRCVSVGRLRDNSFGSVTRDGVFHRLPLVGTGTCGDLRSDPAVVDVAVTPDGPHTVTVLGGIARDWLRAVTVSVDGRRQPVSVNGAAFLAVVPGDRSRRLTAVATLAGGETTTFYEGK